MNYQGIKSIYLFELARAWRTLYQSIVSPVISTSLYFIVFGSAIGSRITEVGGVSYVYALREGRYELVLFLADVEVDRRWVTLVPGEVNLLRP